MARPGAPVAAAWAGLARLVAQAASRTRIARRAAPHSTDADALARTERALPAHDSRRWRRRCSRFPRPAARFPNWSASAADDRRFKAPAWREQPYFRVSEAGLPAVRGIYARSWRSRRRCPNTKDAGLEFMTRQYLTPSRPPISPRPIPMCSRRRSQTEGAQPRAGPAQSRRRCAEGPHHDDRREARSRSAGISR